MHLKIKAKLKMSKKNQKRKNNLGKSYGPPPLQGPNPQVPPVKLREGGCPHREPGVKSDIKGISSAQISGKKFIGVR